MTFQRSSSFLLGLFLSSDLISFLADDMVGHRNGLDGLVPGSGFCEALRVRWFCAVLPCGTQTA